LRATVIERTPLVYAGGADPACDRPAHIRAASAVVRLHGGLAVIQDDAGFVGFVGADDRVSAWPLPAGPDGERQFDDARGNKARKLDLEAALLLRTPGGDTIVAFGSGSTPRRRQVVCIPAAPPHAPVRSVDATPLYEALHRTLDGELNLEGAFLRGGRALRLLQRGNGAGAWNAAVDLTPHWLDQLLAGAAAHPDELAVRRWELGELGRARLSFTDGLDDGDGWWFLAAAEESPDATRDGPVAGSVIGRASGDTGRWAPLTDERGAVLPIKAEGLCASERPGRMLVVLDADDASRPAELLQVRLDGPWRAPIEGSPGG
jgi:hypothetical protein